MFCKFCNVADFKNYCTCSKNGQICPFVRRCMNECVWKPLDSMDKCQLRKDEVQVPKGKNKVRFELHGELYVEDGDFVYTIKNPFEHTPDFVELIMVDGVRYIKGFEPKKDIEKTPKKVRKSKEKEEEQC